MISIDEFKKVEIKIGKIISAEKVEGTDKLILCKVDFNEEVPRQIISGIALHVNPEDLVGKKFPYVTNLEPRIIKGLESNGMLIAVNDSEGKFSLIEPSSGILPGSRIS